MLDRLVLRHFPVDQQREQHVAEHGLPRQQLVEFLEHHHAVGAGPPDLLAVERIAPSTGGMKPAIALSSVDLPQPEGPSTT